jgi:hypothetical protein
MLASSASMQLDGVDGPFCSIDVPEWPLMQSTNEGTIRNASYHDRSRSR